MMLGRRGAVIAGVGTIGVLLLGGCNLGTPPVTYEMVDSTRWPLGPTGLAPGDIDRDGDLDVIVTGQRTAPLGLVNDGGGTFSVDDSRVPSHGAQSSPSLVDLDSDGDLDLLSRARYEETSPVEVPAVNRNDGAGTFGAIELVGPTPPVSGLTDLVASDVDGDGDLDIAASASSHASIYLNDGTGTFGSPVTYPLGFVSTTSNPSHLVAGDLEGDGDVDVVVTNIVEVTSPEGWTSRESHAVVALNDGTGALTVGASFRVGYLGAVWALYPALADLDEDGHLDLAVGGAGGVNILLGDGTGGFGPLTATRTTVSGFDLIVPADIDGDGHADIVGFNSQLDPKTATIVYGDGNGGVGATHEVSTGTKLGDDGTPGRAIQIADIDGDHDPDILFLGGTLGVLENVQGRPDH